MSPIRAHVSCYRPDGAHPRKPQQPRPDPLRLLVPRRGAGMSAPGGIELVAAWLGLLSFAAIFGGLCLVLVAQIFSGGFRPRPSNTESSGGGRGSWWR